MCFFLKVLSPLLSRGARKKKLQSNDDGNVFSLQHPSQIPKGRHLPEAHGNVILGIVAHLFPFGKEVRACDDAFCSSGVFF